MADTEDSNKSEKLNMYMMNVMDECKNQCVTVNVIGNE